MWSYAAQYRNPFPGRVAIKVQRGAGARFSDILHTEMQENMWARLRESRASTKGLFVLPDPRISEVQ